MNMYSWGNKEPKDTSPQIPPAPVTGSNADVAELRVRSDITSQAFDYKMWYLSPVPDYLQETSFP